MKTQLRDAFKAICDELSSLGWGIYDQDDEDTKWEDNQLVAVLIKHIEPLLTPVVDAETEKVIQRAADAAIKAFWNSPVPNRHADFTASVPGDVVTVGPMMCEPDAHAKTFITRQHGDEPQGWVAPY